MTAFSAVSQSLAQNRAAEMPAVSARPSAAFAATLRQLEHDAADMLAMRAVSLTGASIVSARALTVVATDGRTTQPSDAGDRSVRSGWRDERCRVLAQDARPQPEDRPLAGAVIAAAPGRPSEGEDGGVAIAADFTSASIPDDAGATSAADATTGIRAEAATPLLPRDAVADAPADLSSSVDAIVPSQAAASLPASQAESSRRVEGVNAIRAGAAVAAEPTPSSMQAAAITTVMGAPQTASRFDATLVSRATGPLESVMLAAPPTLRSPMAAPPAVALVVAHLAADRAALAVRVAGLSESSERELLVRLRAELGAHGLRCYSLQLNGAGATPASPT